MLVGAALVAAGVSFAEQDYVPGVYANARERAANSLKYAHAPNRMLEKLASGRTSRGGYMELGDPVVAEAAGLAGLDHVWIDAEHHPYTVRDLMLIDIALKGTGCASLVRVRCHEPEYLKQILDTGIDGVIIPMINSVEDAKAAIAACRYPQAGGRRGICVSRQSGYGKTGLWDYLKRSETAPFVCLEIEHVDALKDVDAILALDGYDAIMVGPSDLSCSMGSLRKSATPEVRAIVVDIAKKTRAAGKFFYALSESWEDAVGGADLVDGPADLGSFTGAIRAFVTPPKMSLFESDIVRAAKDAGLSLAEAAAKLQAAGVTGFDAEYNHKLIPELVAAGQIPANFYGFMDFFAADGGKAQADAFVAAAAKWKAPQIMIVPTNFTEGGDEEAEYVKNRDGLRYIVRKALDAGVTPTIEDFGNPRNPCSQMKYMKRFLDDIPELSLALDSGNFHYADRGEDVIALMRLGADRIRHVHLKDFKDVHSREYVTLGDGAVPNEALVRCIHATGYAGWYTLENPVGPNHLEDILRQARLLRSWLR